MSQVSYALPTTYLDGKPLNVADIKQVNIGIRPASGTVGVYPLTVADITFQADAQGLSHEPLDAFGSLAPGKYAGAAQLLMNAGGISDWSPEATFTIAAPKPNPPSNFSVA